MDHLTKHKTKLKMKLNRFAVRFGTMWTGRWSGARASEWRIFESSQNSIAKSSRRVSHHSHKTLCVRIEIGNWMNTNATTKQNKKNETVFKWTFSIFAWQRATIPRWSRNNFLLIVFFSYRYSCSWCALSRASFLCFSHLCFLWANGLEFMFARRRIV